MKIRLALVLVMLISACDAENPDEELRALLIDMEDAAESRNTGFFRGVVADSYRDGRGNDRERLIGLIRGFFLTNANVEAIVRVQEVTLASPESAEVALQAALLSGNGGRSLFGVDGDFYLVELEFVQFGGDWMLIGADWRPVIE